jgi:hypothetical protein
MQEEGPIHCHFYGIKAELLQKYNKERIFLVFDNFFCSPEYCDVSFGKVLFAMMSASLESKHRKLIVHPSYKTIPFHILFLLDSHVLKLVCFNNFRGTRNFEM